MNVCHLRFLSQLTSANGWKVIINWMLFISPFTLSISIFIRKNIETYPNITYLSGLYSFLNTISHQTVIINTMGFITIGGSNIRWMTSTEFSRIQCNWTLFFSRIEWWSSRIQISEMKYGHFIAKPTMCIPQWHLP